MLPYEERLISALTHPVREHRMIAIEVLGRRGYQGAVPAIVKIIETENDYYIVREAMRALYQIGGPECMAIIASLSRHPSPLVRKYAKSLIQDDPRTNHP